MGNFIKFLGTAGARLVLSKQLRQSGGFWLSLDDTNLFVDPGPGALVYTVKARPKLDPTKLDAILLSHKHLDHAGDINVMIEAMTNATHDKRGVVFAPSDALDEDPVIFKYVRKYPEKVERLSVGNTFKVKNISFTCPIKHIHHSAEAYGFKFKGKNTTISYISDTKYFPELPKAYKADILIINVLKQEPAPYEHLYITDVIEIVKKIKPKTTILTHFGYWMVRDNPDKIAKDLSKKLKSNIIAARDGMLFKF
jgi:ribonuclease BN (tRNA processing enzyme)